jgi:BirA family biotin operon repressor/biotin-[acetyl-CoA-carboxylase] ligase
MSIRPNALLRALRADRAVSGSALASALDVTRAAIWKQIQALRALGAPIDAVAGHGYRLTRPFEPLDARAIRARIDPALRRRLGGLDVRWQVDSTSSALLRAAAEGAPDLCVCLAETQSAGRGRRGRSWVSPLGGNGYVSLLKRFESGMGALAGLSLVAGVVVIEALHDCGAAGLGLKWPNDVQVGGRKLAGILVELGGEFLGPCFAVIGIGINLHSSQDSAIDQPVAALVQVCAALPSRNALIARLLSGLLHALDEFETAGFAPFAARFARHDILAGRALRVHTAAGVHDGIGAGVDERGALLVRHGTRVATYDSADVSVRTA